MNMNISNESRQSFDSEEERLVQTSGINVSEIKEWHMELRDNEVSMGEENVKAKKKKLDHEEQSLEEQLAEEKKAQEERNKKLAEQEKEVAETRDNLRRLEFEFREKNAILEILLKVNNRVETMTLDLSNLNSTSSSRANLPITFTDSNDTSQSGSGLQSSDDLREDRVREREERIEVRGMGLDNDWSKVKM